MKRRWHVIVLILLGLAMLLPGLSGLPVVDRDEARYAQASIQMAESGDWLNIRLQDEARNKKPAAAYWAQSAMIKAFTKPSERKIWVQRIPSVLAALISILALYWGGLRMVGRRAAFIAGCLLATSLIFVFEGHIAKTDALLCASTTLILAAMGRLRNGGGVERFRAEVWVFWVALGASLMIKGPIGPALVVLSMLTLLVWERNLSWARPLLNWGAILMFCLIWVPWAIAMFLITDGAFFIESLGNDFGGKIVSAQENHAGPPGYHAGVIWVALWPACLFLIPGFVYAVKAVRSRQDNPIVRTMRLCFAWAIPFWMMIEIMPTKLPHYGLPVYPALCLMMGVAILAMGQLKTFNVSRFIGGLLFIISGAGVVGGVMAVQSLYGDQANLLPTYILIGICGLLVLLSGFCLWGNRIRTSLSLGIASAVLMSAVTYGFVFPRLAPFHTPERLALEIRAFAPDIRPVNIYSPDFAEPSLVYHVGTDIHLGGDELPELDAETLLILDLDRPESATRSQSLSKAATARGTCLRMSEPVSGMNYSEGADVRLVLIREGACLTPE